MTSVEGTPAGWYADPDGRFEYRWWDGVGWTSTVSTAGEVQQDPPGQPLTPLVPPAPVNPQPPGAHDRSGHVPQGSQSAEKIQSQVAKAGKSVQAGQPVSAGQQNLAAGYDLLNEQVFVVNQKAKLIEVSNEYAVYNSEGTQIGGVRQVGQSAFRKFLRIFFDFDQFFTHRLEIVDLSGRTVLKVTRPAKFFKSKFEVAGPSGGLVGRIVQQNMIGKIRFGLMVGENQIGSINAENWRAWNFSIRDHNDNEVARITKTWEGLAKTMFTTADNYVVHVHSPLTEPLRSMVVAAALSVDTALKQDKRGFN